MATLAFRVAGLPAFVMLPIAIIPLWHINSHSAMQVCPSSDFPGTAAAFGGSVCTNCCQVLHACLEFVSSSKYCVALDGLTVRAFHVLRELC